jgi:hypothetical protein
LGEEGGGIAGIGIFRPCGQRLAFGQGCAGAGEQIADAAHGDQLLAMHAILERHEDVPSALDGGGQKPGTAGQRHEAGGGGAGAPGPCAFDHAIAVIGDEDESAAGDGQQQEHECACGKPHREGNVEGKSEHGGRFRPTPWSGGAEEKGFAVRLFNRRGRRAGAPRCSLEFAWLYQQ